MLSYWPVHFLESKIDGLNRYKPNSHGSIVYLIWKKWCNRLLFTSAVYFNQSTNKTFTHIFINKNLFVNQISFLPSEGSQFFRPQFGVRGDWKWWWIRVYLGSSLRRYRSVALRRLKRLGQRHRTASQSPDVCYLWNWLRFQGFHSNISCALCWWPNMLSISCFFGCYAFFRFCQFTRVERKKTLAISDFWLSYEWTYRVVFV